MNVLTEKINFHNEFNIELYIKREDLIHPIISGNKYRKLKYNLFEAIKLNKKGILTFGGAFSNHIVATAYAAKLNQLQSIGIIRGDELAHEPLNHSLKHAQSDGMHLIFVNRNEYRQKNNADYLSKLSLQYLDFYIIPEGGTNDLAIKGCEEILTPKDKIFDYICCSVGTGGTISGLINSSYENQQIIGFPALKEDFSHIELEKYSKKTNWQLVRDYHFGGYAKHDDELIKFINDFNKNFNIPLDPIYTGKMVFGVFDKINQGFFKPKSKILMIHTGGLQGINGINEQLILQKKELIST